MQLRTFAALPLLVGALAFTGCTPASDTAGTSPSTSATTSATTPARETSGPSTEPETTSPQPADGAYLEYRDGAIESTSGPKALFFHASWCPQCRALDEALRAEGSPDGLTVFKVDYDSRTDLRQQYEVTLQTTIVFVDDDGDKVSSVVLYDEPTVDSLRAAIP